MLTASLLLLPLQGLSGRLPPAGAPEALLSALSSHDLFLYFGHGSGEQYLPLPTLRQLHRCAANLLMGCSSGKLRLHGSYDPAGAVLAYCMAGGSWHRVMCACRGVGGLLKGGWGAGLLNYT